MADHLVSIYQIPVLGDDPKYRLDNLTRTTLARWATETRQLLRQHPQLRHERVLLRDSIRNEAKQALWDVEETLHDIPKDYPNEAMANATSDRGRKDRADWHDAWLEKIINACAPTSPEQAAAMMKQIEFKTSGKEAEADDVVRYSAKLYKLQGRIGVAMVLLSDKYKLEIVKDALPKTLTNIIKTTTPVPADGEGPYHDTWEQALRRLVTRMRKAHDLQPVYEAMNGSGSDRRKPPLLEQVPLVHAEV